MANEATAENAVSRAIKSYFTEFGALRSCSRNFWVVQLVNLLDGVAYFAMLTVSTLYLSETLGFNDKNAAWLWGACMAVYTGVGFVAGFIGDSLGIKRTLHLSVVLLVVSRLAISFTESRLVVLPALFVIAVGTAIMTPILISATKRYTTKANQTAGFNMLYFLMNVGAFVGNFTLDPLRAMEWGNRTIFMVGSVMSILCWITILVLWRSGIDDVDEQLRRARARKAAGQGGEDTGAGAGAEEKWEAPWTIAASVFRESAFWRFMLFLAILVGVRLVFEHQYQVYPKYYQRTIAEYRFDVPLGTVGDLARGEVSDALRQAFADHERVLSQAAAISTGERDGEWQVTDGQTAYRIVNRLTLRVIDVPITGAADEEPAVWTLSDVGADVLKALDRRRLPPALVQSFSDHGRPLPNARKSDVRFKKTNTFWRLTIDGNRYVFVTKAASRLRVYLATTRPNNVTSRAEPGAQGSLTGEHLFDLGVGTLGLLNVSRVSDSLRLAFEENDLVLPASARVLVREEGSRWQIRFKDQDDGTTYYVRKDESQISIYATDAPIGLLNSINPAIICIGVIVSTPIVARFKLFNVMLVGICFSAASMVFLTIYPGWFTGLLGLSLSQGYTVIVVAQIVVFSFGEVIWSPRLYEYTAAIAPEGREASYMGLSYLPMFFARFAEGPLAGEMLTRYCPPDVGARLSAVPYAHSPQFMSVILAAIAIATPLLILLFRGVIQKEAKQGV